MAGDDLSGAYVEDLAARVRAQAAKSLLERVRARTGGGTAGKSQPSPTGPVAPPTATPQSQSFLTRVGDAAAAVGGDVLYGATVDLPRAFLHGVRDGAQEAFDLGETVGKWLDDNVADLGFASETPPQLPDTRKLLGETESTTGGLLKSAVQFMAGFKGAGAVVKAGGVAGAAAKGAISDFTAFDGHEQKLGDLWKSAGLPDNVLTDYLSSSPDDTEFEGRFKNALQGVGLGAAVDGLVMGARAIRTARLARQSPVQPADPAEAAKAVPQTKAKDFEVLGDVDQDAVIGVKAPPEPVDFGVPDDVAAKGMAGSARDAAAAAAAARPKIQAFHGSGAQFDVFDMKQVGTGEGAQSFGHGLYFAEEPYVAQSYRRGIGGYQVVEPGGAARGMDKLSPMERQAAVDVLSRGDDAGRAISVEEALDQAQADKSEHGAKLRAVLGDWAKRGVKVEEKGSLYQVELDVDPEDLLDYDKPLAEQSAKVKAKLEKSGMLSELREFYKDRPTPPENMKAAEFYRGLAETTEEASRMLKEAGIPGLRYLDAGSRGAGKGTSNFVMFDEGKVRITTRDGQPVAAATPARAPIPQPHKPEFFINWARIDEPDDVKNVMAQMADAFRPEVEGARRGKVTFQQIKEEAADKDGFKILMSRRQGEPLKDSDMLAARQFHAMTMAKLKEVTELAATNPSEANLFAYRKMVETGRAVQSELMGARAEIARAQAAMRIPVGVGDAIRHREIADVLESIGGREPTRELAIRMSAAFKKGDANLINELVDKGAAAKTVDAVREIWINGLLSNPATHAVNAISNMGVLAQSIGERAVAARLGRTIGDNQRVELGEAAAMMSGLVDGWKDGLKYAWQMARTGKDGFVLPGSKVDDGRVPSITAENWGLNSGSWLGKSVDGVGNFIRTPGRTLAAGDQFFKSVGYRMELNAQAVRMAEQEVRAGTIKPTEVRQRIADIVASPPDTVKLAAADQALYQTFNNKPGQFAASLMKLKDKHPALNVLIPFVRTPANIFNYTAERTPLAPLFSRFRADVAAGGARRDLALTKMATGSMIMFAVADMAMAGHITGGGPKDANAKAALQRSGWQPFSVKTGDSYIAYNRLDPIGMTMSLAADMVDILHNTDWDANDTKTSEEMVFAAAGAIANSVMSKNYMQGISELFTAFGDKSGTGFKRFFEQTAGSVIPAGVATIERVQDPWLREASGMVDAIKNRTPFLGDDAPAVRDLWGRPRSYESGLGWAYDALSPIYYRRNNPEPIDGEILKHEMNIPMPTRVQSFNGQRVDLDRHPGAYSRFLELMGQEVELPAKGKGAMNFLNAVVSGQHPLSAIYRLRSDGPDGGKESWVKDQLSDFRAAARARLLTEFPALAEEIGWKKARAAERERQTLAGGPQVQ